MNISYIWVSKYRNLKNFEISLSNTSKFSLENNKIEKNDYEFDQKGLYLEGVTSLTGVVGSENKLETLQMISNVVKDTDCLGTENFIVIYEKDSKLHYVTNKSDVSFSFDLKLGELSDFDSLDVMFYSHKLEQSQLEFGESVKDLSITKLINDSMEYNINPLEKRLDLQKEFINSEFYNLDTDKKVSYKKEKGQGVWKNLTNFDLVYVNLLSMILDSYKNGSVRKETLICIDELDSGMSQTDQIKLIKTLTEKVLDLIGEKVQFVLTTNSIPVLTDIPKHYIHSSNDKEVKSFGGNVFDIFRTVFDSSNPLGSISKNYLDNILDLMDKENLTKEEVLHLKNALLIIDDELINYHLSKTIASKLGECFQKDHREFF